MLPPKPAAKIQEYFNSAIELNVFDKKTFYTTFIHEMSVEEENRDFWSKILEGDKQSLFDLYNNTYFHLLRFGLKVCADNDLVADCVNQLFLNIWDRRERLQPVKNVRAYLFTSLRRNILDQLSYQSKIDLAVSNMQAADQETELSYEEILIRVQHDEEVRKKLNTALKKLSPKQIEFVKLKFFEGLSYEQIASSTTQSIKTCYNVIHDAVKTLKRDLLPEIDKKKREF